MSAAVAELLERVRALTPEERELFEVGLEEVVLFNKAVEAVFFVINRQ